MSLCRDFACGSHSCSQLLLAGSQHFYFSASGTPSRSVMAPITGLLLGWTAKTWIKLEQTWEEIPHSLSSIWDWGHFQGDGAKSLVCFTLALGRVPLQSQDGWGYERWWFIKSICGSLHKRSWAPKTLAWDDYSKIDLESKKLDLMTQDALCNPFFLWLAVNRAGDCVVLLTDVREVASLHVCFL